MDEQIKLTRLRDGVSLVFDFHVHQYTCQFIRQAKEDRMILVTPCRNPCCHSLLGESTVMIRPVMLVGAQLGS